MSDNDKTQAVLAGAGYIDLQGMLVKENKIVSVQKHPTYEEAYPSIIVNTVEGSIVFQDFTIDQFAEAVLRQQVVGSEFERSLNDA